MNLRKQFIDHVAQTSEMPIGIEVERAEGIWLYGPNGEKWMDFIAGICVNNIGHGVPEVLEAILDQSQKYLHPLVYGEVIMAPQVQYAHMLTECLSPGLETVYFVNSGAEAIEGAMKIAKKFTGRSKLVSCLNGYHGSTHGALSVTGYAEKKKGYGPLLPQITHIPFNELTALEEIDEYTAAIVIEPIQGAGGMIVPDDGYLLAVKQRCEQVGALMILDEIQTGFGRTGHLFAHQGMGFEPDILVLAKAMGGGLPLGGFISSRKIMSVIETNPILGHLTTYGGHPLCCAAGKALLTYIIEHELCDRVSQLEQILRARLQVPGVKLRGHGLMYALLLEDFEKAEGLRKKALENGLLTIGFLHIPNGLRITPPLTITTEEMHHACDIILSSL